MNNSPLRRNWIFIPLLVFGLVCPLRAAIQFSTANSNVSSPLNAVAYDGVSKFVAVGTNSVVATATLAANGLVWTSNSVPTPNMTLLAVTFGDGIFVASGENNNIYSSSNGINWITKSNVFSNSAYVEGLSFNAGHFVAVAAAPEAAWANASLSWQTAIVTNLSFLDSFRAVTPFSTNGFALCGVFGRVAISQDAGQDWNINHGSISEPYLFGIASDGRELVCVGAGGAILVAANGGTNWFVATSGTTTNLNAVAYTAPGFIAVGDHGLILTSADGTNWNANVSPTTNNLHGVAFAASGVFQGIAVLVGDGGTVVIGGTLPSTTLGINQFGNAVQLRWIGNWQLQSTTNLSCTNCWTTLTNGVGGITNFWTNAIIQSPTYFRLSQ